MDNSLCINFQNCTRNLPSGSDDLVGWIPESPGRGTLNILSTCLLTIFLCTWVVIHPRIDRRKKFRLLHKLALCFKTVLAPELIAVEGAQEWTQARKTIKSCEQCTDGDLRLIQAFYVGMLGLRYRTPHGTKVIWPNQFAWLLEKRLFHWSNNADWGLTVENIKDKSNADGAAKFFALVQVGWFVVQSIIRVAHDLPLAPFESMTLAYIPLFALAYFFWWVKPKDIEVPSYVDLPAMSETEIREFESMAVSNDFDDHGANDQESLWSVFNLTPRVFEKEVRDRRRAEIVQHNEVWQISDIGHAGLQRAKPLSSKTKGDTVLAHWDPDLYHSKLWPITCLFGISFGALHMISWDGTFPTVFELWLWRAAAIASMVAMLIFMQFEKVVVRWQDPLMVVKVLSPTIYLLSRMVMLAEAIAAFRGASPAIYETYVVSNYWLHLS